MNTGFLPGLKQSLNLAPVIAGVQQLIFLVTALFLLITGISSVAVVLAVVVLLALRVYVLVGVLKRLGSERWTTAFHFWIKKILNYLDTVSIIVFLLLVMEVSQRNHGQDWIHTLGLLLCFAFLGFSIFNLFQLNNPRFMKSKGLAQVVEHKQKKRLIRVSFIKNRIVRTVLDWVESLIWAVIAVILINSMVVQVYEIPSESMVPTFFVGNRPVVFKTANNPQIPFTSLSVPIRSPYQRFDVAILENPRAEGILERTAGQYLNDLGFMLSFSLVKSSQKAPNGTFYPLNQRFDEFGMPIISPLVKRIVAGQDEQVMILDDILYIRTKGEENFKPIAQDRQFSFTALTWRKLEKIQDEVLTKSWQEYLLAIDKERRSLDVGQYRSRLMQNAEALLRGIGVSDAQLGFLRSQALESQTRAQYFSFSAQELPEYGRDDDERIALLEETFSRGGDALIGIQEKMRGLLETLKLSESAQRELLQYAAARFSDASLQTWSDSSELTSKTFEQAGARLELIHRDLIVRVLQAMQSTQPGAGIEARSLSLELLRLQSLYVAKYYGWRNLAPFPQGEQFFAPGEYFAIGDNRYNSLDCRHWDQRTLFARSLVAQDPQALSYVDRNNPFALNEIYLKGRELFTLRF